MNGSFWCSGSDRQRKGIDKEILIDAIEASALSAYKKNFGTSQNVQVNIDKSTGVVKVYAMKTIVDEVVDESADLFRRCKIDPVYKLGML